MASLWSSAPDTLCSKCALEGRQRCHVKVDPVPVMPEGLVCLHLTWGRVCSFLFRSSASSLHDYCSRVSPGLLVSRPPLPWIYHSAVKGMAPEQIHLSHFLAKCFCWFLSAGRRESPALTLLDSALASLSSLISNHSVSHSQCLCYTQVLRVFQVFWTMWLYIFFLDKDHFPVLLSRKHLHISPIFAEYLLFPLLEPYSTFPHLLCVQEVDLRGCHQWVHGQLGASEGDQKERGDVFLWFFPFKVTELAMSLTSPP